MRVLTRQIRCERIGVSKSLWKRRKRKWRRRGGNVSLQVWLPLINDVHNQGASGISVVNNGATVNTSGKIGSCYAFNGSTGYIALSGSDLFKIFTGGTQQFSVTMWVFHADTTRAILFGDYATSGGIGFNIELSTAHGVRFYWNGSPDTYPANATVAASAWTHVALTYDGTKLQSYINGVEKGSWSGTLAAKNKTSGEFRLGRDNRSDSTAFNGRMNDFRIYDHALSAAEVSEISQGLVLHYKLNDAPILCKTNLTTWSKESGVTSTAQDDGSVKIDCTAKTSSRWGIYCDIQNVLPNTPYTFSVDCKTAHVDKKWQLSVGCNPVPSGTSQFGSNRATMNSTSGFTTYTATVTTNADTTWIRFYLALSCSSTTPEYQYAFVKNVKMTIGTSLQTTIQDSSGYGNDGIINSNPTISLETARYNHSISFDGVDDCIKIPFNDIIKDKNYTVSVWTYKTSIGTKNYQTILGGPSGFELEARSSSSTSPLYRIHNWGGGTTAYEFNKWNLFTFVHTDSNSKLYVNCELKITGTSANIPTGNYYIGAWNSVTGQNYEGLMSDFRIYCTALDADAIRQLYEVSAKIDNKQNLHTFELVEPATKISINKQGQILCNELEETSATKFFKTNQIIETNNLIEL